MLNRILIPLDGSPLSKRILLHVRRILLRQDAEVTLLRVCPPDVPGGLKVLEREELEEATASTQAVMAELEREGARARCVIRRGDAAEEILAYANEYQPGLIAMSTHGRSGFDRWIWGSVAERVLRRSTHPLLLANPHALEDEKIPTDRRFARILVPLDGSEPSAAILPIVSEIAHMYESDVTLFYTEPILVASVQYPAVPVIPAKEEGEKVLAPFRERLAAAGIRAKTWVAFEPPASGVLRAIELTKADLVAMTTHGRSGFSRWALGSVAEKVVRHSEVPVLVRRTSGFDEGGSRKEK